MNIYKGLNEITKYIEEHIEEKIDYNKLARIIGTNSYTMQRIFALLTNSTLADYIRKRRLSLAAYDLYSKKIDIIDTAMNGRLSNEELSEIRSDIPLGRLGRAIDIAKCINWLIEDEFTTGQIISVNGGWVIT